MSLKVFTVNIELDIQAVTCPGVWLCPNGNIILKIYTFGSVAKTSGSKPVFPLLYHQRMIFQKNIHSAHSLLDLQHLLGEELLYAELIQRSGCQDIVLATFETSLLELLYPSPYLRKGLVAGVDVNLLMEPTRCFPGILAPKIEVTTQTTIEEHASSPSSCKRNPGLINPKMLSSKRCSSPDKLNKCRILQPLKREINSLKMEGTSQKCRHCIPPDCNCRDLEIESWLAKLKDTLHKCSPQQECMCTSSDEKCCRISKFCCSCEKEDQGESRHKHMNIKKDNTIKRCRCCLEEKEGIHSTCLCSVCRTYNSYFGKQVY